jgi:hypothetical protein
MAQFSTASKQCPLCNSVAVEKADDNISFKRRPSHRCTKCGAALTTKMTWEVAWCVPALGVSIATFSITFPWIQQSQMPGALQTVLMAGIGGLGASFAFQPLVRGIVFEPWKE